MSWINFFFFIICLNTVTGTVAYFLCTPLVRFAEKAGAVRIIYPLYRLVVVFYVVPVGYLCNRFLYYERVRTDTIGDFFFGNEIIRMIVLAVSVVWIIGAVVKAVQYMKKYRSFLWTKRKNLPFLDDGIMDTLRSCYPGVNWKRVTLSTNFLIKSPCVMGTFRHELVLQEADYSENDLKIILMHEAAHIARHDNLWKKIGLAIIIINWFNKPLREFVDEMDEWSDASCDITVCSRFLGNNPVEYFEVLMRTRAKGYSLIPPFVSHMSSQDSLKRRMERMIKWKVNGRRALVSVLLTTVLVAGSSVTALAAGTGMVKTQRDLYKATRDTETDIANTYTDLEEFEIPADEVDEEKWENAVVYGEEGIEPMAVQKYFDWLVPVGEFARSTVFIKKAGTTITVSCYVYSDRYHRVGIRRPNGSMLYVNGKGQVTHIFNCEKYGTYYVFVENMGSTDLHASGYYVR